MAANNVYIKSEVVGTSDKSVVLKVSDDPAVKMEFVRSAVAQVVREQPAQETTKK